ncbi:DUF6930 domain-containing protein [Maioricimonas rarisocia]|uniref:DUF6930 domain-containing protein n=1 Tax=Maioricimonas rarisocia TaxID=2528026 RepID=UPI0018D24772|nr:hypothetical protein [Maioricimonas rarisocia]
MASRKNRKSGKKPKRKAKLTGKQARLRRANQLVNRACDCEDPQEQIALAREAIELSDECSSAWVLLGDIAPTDEESLPLYERAVVAADKHLGTKAIAQLDAGERFIDDWDPWFCAHADLAHCLRSLGRLSEAIGRFERLLRIIPHEEVGVRNCLAATLLHEERDDDLSELLKQYAHDDSTYWRFTHVLTHFRRRGNTLHTDRLLNKACESNRFVLVYLSSLKELPREIPEFQPPGSEAEAIWYVKEFLRYWQQTPGAIDWIRSELQNRLLAESLLGDLRQNSGIYWQGLMPRVAELPVSKHPDWTIDLVRMPVEDEDGNRLWVVFITDPRPGVPLGMESFLERPSDPEVFEVLLKAMLEPVNGSPSRPAVLRMKRKGFFSAWQKRLGKVGIDCKLVKELPEIDRSLEIVQLDEDRRQLATQEDALSDDRLRELPLQENAVWRVAARQLPTWLNIEGEMVRPYVRLVVDLTEAKILQSDLSEGETLPDGWLKEGLAITMLSPGVGDPRRPAAIEFDPEAPTDGLEDWLGGLDVAFAKVEETEPIDYLLADLTGHLTGPGRPPSLVNTAGMTTELVATLCDAAWSFYVSRPWDRIPGDAILKIECDAWKSGPWYANVMGQLGMELGLALYEDPGLLQRLVAGQISDEEMARQMSSLTLSYSEKYDMAPDDVDAIETHGWPVADDQAWPNVVRINPGISRRAALPWEVELLIACLRAIPTTLTGTGVRTGWGEVETVGRTVRIQVSLEEG